MTSPRPHRWPFAALLACGLCATLVACGERPRESLTYEGSGTLFSALRPEMLALFERKSGVRFGEVNTHGSSAGFRAVMEGRAALGGLSRPLKSGERAARPYYAILGYDAIQVFVHSSNPVTHLTHAQLRDVFTGKVTHWKELGGPDAPIELAFHRRNADYGTGEVFMDQALEGAPFGPGVTCDPPDCSTYVAAHPYSVAFGSMVFRAEGAKVVALDGMLPEPAAVRSGEYLLSRPLLLLTKQAPRGDLRAFLDLALSDQGQALVAKHFVPAREVR